MFKLATSTISSIEDSVNESILNILTRISTKYSIDLKELKSVAFNKEYEEEEIEELEISKPKTKSSESKEVSSTNGAKGDKKAIKKEDKSDSSTNGATAKAQKQSD